jgi:hypothetical protein
MEFVHVGIETAIGAFTVAKWDMDVQKHAKV